VKPGNRKTPKTHHSSTLKPKDWLAMSRNLFIPIAAALLVGCASTTPTERADMLDRPINCSSADVDIAVLKEAIPGANERLASRVRLVIPISHIAGRLSGEHDARREIASGRTEETLRARIAEIEATCPAANSLKPKPIG
jgi:hypothetical protein